MTELKAILDLDGVCGDYLPWLFKFLSVRTLGYTYEDAWKTLEDTDRVHRAAGLERWDYENLKKEYRNGPKWQMPAIEGMPGLTHALHRNEFKVLIATNRAPEHKEKTADWLRRNEFYFDDLSAVGSGTMGKYRRAAEELGISKDDEGVIVVEDTFGGALSAGRMGWRPVLHNWPHNAWNDSLGTRRAFERQYSIERYDNTARLMDILLEFKEEQS